MSRTAIDIIVLFVAMLLLQILIFNHVVLFHVAVPMVFIYFIIRLPMGMNTNLLLTLSFLLGFIMDIFSDTLGVNSLCCTILAIVKEPIFYSYVQRDDLNKNILPSVVRLGAWVYSKYLLSMTAVYCVLAFTIEYFSFASVKEIIIASVSSWALSFILMFGIDGLMFTRREKRL